MISLEQVYWLGAVFFALCALFSARDASNPKRWRSALFWLLMAISFAFGSWIGDLANGVIVVLLALLAGFGGIGGSRAAPTSSEADRQDSAARLRHRLFVPALMIPVTALAGTFLLDKIRIGAWSLFADSQQTLIALALGVVLALLAARLLLRCRWAEPAEDGWRLMDSVGWSGVLPQMLAALGAVFAVSGLGDEVGRLITTLFDLHSNLMAVAVYCIGMALFTMVMGNAFAAFPVMTAAVGLPLLIVEHGGNPAIVCAIGMLSGFCGTLCTPMAANFNVVPATLLGLPDRNAAFNGVIRAQMPTAIVVLAINIVLMWQLAFRF